ncbi:AAA family ATPase [Candidatus Peregrinibacteria bacterium CG_4_10_14_0_2_um_filter_38_24]|nr:MAG: AAA family ATPase [Candidatus Peregrinibacteria bacterium CG_4_10_14_0_2_um_filter_38_24]
MLKFLKKKNSPKGVPKNPVDGGENDFSGIEINEYFRKALDLMENTEKTLFITGKAGTGKSTLLQYFRETTGKNIVVLAPTGVAAINVKGQTIHSFFHFPPHITKDTVREKEPSKKLIELLKHVDVIVIDEISMVRADLLDCVDEILKFCLKSDDPFGGMQMIFIGDLYQLPPVVSSKEEKEMFQTYYLSPYFFDAKILENIKIELVELEKIYRQKDPDFIELLNKIRNSSVQDKDVEKLNSRYVQDFNDYDNREDFCITLTTTNSSADTINSRKLSQLKTKIKKYHGDITGEFDNKHLPTSLELEMKIGAQIMLLSNDSAGRWVNGTIGKIIDIKSDEESGEDLLVVELQNGSHVNVSQYSWEIYKYVFDRNKGKLEADIMGSFLQYPVRLAWAVTIHKSQGKTFENVAVDIGNGAFAQGQVYVAISRCTSFEGLILKKPIYKKHIWIDYHIVRFLTGFQYDMSEKEMPLSKKIERIESAIKAGETLGIIYLKADDTKSHREIKPFSVGEMKYLNKTFIGIEAYCSNRKEIRTFRVDRILSIK